jgi:hypothetical protein
MLIILINWNKKTEETDSPEMFVTMYETTWCHNQEDENLNISQKIKRNRMAVIEGIILSSCHLLGCDQLTFTLFIMYQ